ncbi:hypothetical protein M2G56_20585, partial [Vibrio vulnificus]|nr:hypothetical protein [Vibrio vulnificus]
NSGTMGFQYSSISILDMWRTQMRYNAQLRGEQRFHPNLNHCAINAKFEVEAKMPSVVNPS